MKRYVFAAFCMLASTVAIAQTADLVNDAQTLSIEI